MMTNRHLFLSILATQMVLWTTAFVAHTPRPSVSRTATRTWPSLSLSPTDMDHPEAILHYLNDESGKGLSFSEYQQLEESKRFIGSCPVFSGVSQFDRERLASSVQKIQVSEGDTLIKEGDKGAEAMYFVVSGKLEARKVDKETGTDMSLVTYQRPGEYFGELALLFDQPRAASILATEDSVVYKLDKGSFLQSMVESPLYDTARQIILKKYQSISIREVLSKIHIDELIALLKAKLQPKKKLVSIESTLSTFSLGAASAVLASVWSPGLDAVSRWPLIFNLNQGLSNVPVQPASLLLTTTAVLGAFALPKEAPAGKKLWYSMGALVSMGVVAMMSLGRAKSNISLLLLQLLVCIRTTMMRTNIKEKTKIKSITSVIVGGILGYEALRSWLLPLKFSV